MNWQSGVRFGLVWSIAHVMIDGCSDSKYYALRSSIRNYEMRHMDMRIHILHNKEEDYQSKI